MSEQDKRAASICEAMADIPQQSPRTPLVWAYELKAQRDEMLKLLKEIQAGEEFTTTFYSRLDALIEKVEATL